MSITSKRLAIGKALAFLECKLTTRPMGAAMSLAFWSALALYLLISTFIVVQMFMGDALQTPVVFYVANTSTLFVTIVFSALSWVKFNRKAASLLKNREHLIKSDLSRKIISAWSKRKVFISSKLYVLIPIFLSLLYSTVYELTTLLTVGILKSSLSQELMRFFGFSICVVVGSFGLVFALMATSKLHTAKVGNRFASLPELVQKWATHRAQQAGVSIEDASFMAAATKEYKANKKHAMEQARTLQNATMKVSPISPATRRRL